ncbi:Actin cross-linking [Quillaja saponaria]|uniref:Actin cross-linking n=1 Tax=Quillaja saponaria TaxID=32244 RepID=A0AAD7P6B1_QUISA|nr:Actin cross-linking [Quillaja saponaria]
MEFFKQAKAVKLRSHLDKYLVADDDQKTVRQSRNGSTRKAKWVVELVEGKSDCVKLKSFHGHGGYLTATDMAFLLGMTGNKVIQADYEKGMDWKYEWEAIRDGFQVKLRSWCGKYLRANGGTPPWRNSITHDDPHTSSTLNWILWDVEAVEDIESYTAESILSSLSSVSDEALDSEMGSPMSVFSTKSPRLNSNFQDSQIISSNKFRSTTAMDFFYNAKAVRLRSHHNKYLHADDDEEAVTQDRNGSSNTARWFVEFVPEFENIIRLKSCYGKYLTASNQPFLLGMTGRKVLQTLPRRLDSSVEWEPIREGNHVKLKTRYAQFLRANGGLPPWRNSITHDIPQRTATQEWILWDVDVVEILVRSPHVSHSDSLDFKPKSPSAPPISIKSGRFLRQESRDLNVNVSSPPKSDGRTIYYHVAEDNGEVEDEDVQGYTFSFKGHGVEELSRKLKEETGLEGMILCTRSPLNGKLYPLRLQLPPNNADMHVILVLESSTFGQDLAKQGLL